MSSRQPRQGMRLGPARGATQESVTSDDAMANALCVRSTNRKSIVGSLSATYKASIRDICLLGRQWSPLSTIKPFSLRAPELPYIHSTQDTRNNTNPIARQLTQSCLSVVLPICTINVSISEQIEATVSESVEANASCSSVNNYISCTVVTCLAEPFSGEREALSLIKHSLHSSVMIHRPVMSCPDREAFRYGLMRANSSLLLHYLRIYASRLKPAIKVVLLDKPSYRRTLADMNTVQQDQVCEGRLTIV